MLGVGYIIGPATSAQMMAGGVLAYLVLIPLIAFFGDGLVQPVFPATKLIRDMDPDDIRVELRALHRRRRGGDGRLRQPRAGAAHDRQRLQSGIKNFSTGRSRLSRPQAAPNPRLLRSRWIPRPRRERAGGETSPAVPRTSRTCPSASSSTARSASWSLIWLAPTLHIKLVPAILIMLFGFFFVDGLVADHRRDRLLVQPHLGHDGRDAAPHLPPLPRHGLGRASTTAPWRSPRRRSSASRRRTAAPPART